jgi:formylmethanofuran dehydrogenase subunit A
MFALPRWVLKAGDVVVEDGELRASCAGRTLHVDPGFDPVEETAIASWFETSASLRFGNFGVSDEEVQNPTLASGAEP